MTKFVAVYARISKDAQGRTEGVKAQEKWGREYAAERWPGVPVVAFVDNDISAASGAARPGYEALRAAVAAGQVGQLWTVEQSRLERREVEWFRLAAELDAGGIPEVHTKRDGVVRVRDEIAGIKAVLNAGEVRRLKQRVNDRLGEIAAAGRPAGARVYGYRRGFDADGGKTLVIDEDEAEIIRETADRILSGWSVARIVVDLRERGVQGVHRRKVRDAAGEIVGDRPTVITATSIVSWVTNPTVAGRRVHKGTVLGTGVWPAILDEDTWHAVRNRLAAPRVVERGDGGEYPLTGKARRTARRYLFTGGVARCGVCGAALIASVKQLKGRTRLVPYYLCHPSQGGRACVGIMAEQFEALVVERLLAELDKPAFRASFAADEHEATRNAVTAALRGLDGQRNDLARMWAERDLSADEWRTARTALDARERQLRRDLAAVPAAPAGRVDLSLIREGWEEMTLDERREIVGMFVERVTVNRATPGTNRFDPTRVVVEWARG